MLFVLFNYYCFNNMMEHVSYDTILELDELARNISWPDGLTLNWLWHGHGCKPWWRKFNSLFAKNWYGMNIKRWREP